MSPHKENVRIGNVMIVCAIFALLGYVAGSQSDDYHVAQRTEAASAERSCEPAQRKHTEIVSNGRQ